MRPRRECCPTPGLCPHCPPFGPCPRCPPFGPCPPCPPFHPHLHQPKKQQSGDERTVPKRLVLRVRAFNSTP